MKIFGEKSVPLRIENTFHARVGDEIEIGIEHMKILKLSAVSYLLPLLGLVGGGSIATAANSSDGVAFAGAMLGLVAGFVYGRRLFRSDRWEPTFAHWCAISAPSWAAALR